MLIYIHIQSLHTKYDYNPWCQPWHWCVKDDPIGASHSTDQKAVVSWPIAVKKWSYTTAQTHDWLLVAEAEESNDAIFLAHHKL